MTDVMSFEDGYGYTPLPGTRIIITTVAGQPLPEPLVVEPGEFLTIRPILAMPLGPDTREIPK